MKILAAEGEKKEFKKVEAYTWTRTLSSGRMNYAEETVSRYGLCCQHWEVKREGKGRQN